MLPNIPMIPMIKILSQYAAAHEFPFDGKNMESISQIFLKYNQDAQILN